MNFQNYKKYFFYLLVILTVFIIDRLTKVLIINILEDTGSVDIYINSFLSFYLVWNTGIGFGLMSYDQGQIYNTITVIIGIINLIIIYLLSIEKIYKAFFLAIILGGSLGNFIDRLYFNAVPDFIDLNYKGYHWFIFNVADVFITIGIICLIFAEILNYKKLK
tara:strand:+ start:510 stop:998 length:489 start_codon:yes stop_codon:yes gene_type:complete